MNNSWLLGNRERDSGGPQASFLFFWTGPVSDFIKMYRFGPVQLPFYLSNPVLVFVKTYQSGPVYQNTDCAEL